MSILQLKKWYSDFASDGGDIAGYIYMMAIKLAGIPFGNVAVHFSDRNGEEYRQTKTYRIDGRAWGIDPIIGGNSVRPGGSGSTLSVNMANLSLTLDYTGRDEVWSPTPDGDLLDETHCRINWKVLQLVACVARSMRPAVQLQSTGGGIVIS